jgi:hypothetical protein
MKKVWLLLIALITCSLMSACGGNYSTVAPYSPLGADTTAMPPYPPSKDMPPTLTPTPQIKFVGPECFVDRGRRFSLRLPYGWFASNPLSDSGISSLSNYNPDEIKYDHGAPVNLPPGHIKIEISYIQLDSEQTLEQWMNGEIASINSPISGRLDAKASQPYSYKLGKYEGLTFTITDTVGWNARLIALALDGGKIISIHLYPANSPAFSEALSILSTLDASGTGSCSTSAVPMSEGTPAPLPSSGESRVPDVAQYTCATGTFSQDEAIDSSLPLQMPFRRGEAWVVGGSGSFYGNYHHCNYYNNYYATDWNRPDNKDQGWYVVAVAPGTVSSVDAPPCTTERYGCYIDVDHGPYYRTRYAHLESVSAQVGNAVYAGTIVGTVGDSGTTAGNYHLHLSFWYKDFAYGYYDYYSRCFNNGQT